MVAILRDIVKLILPQYPDLDATSRLSVERDVTAYVAAQIDAMPSFLRPGYKLALLAFQGLSLLRYGRPFRALPEAQRATYLALWNNAPILPMRDFVKLIRSSSLLVFFDHTLVRACLEAQQPSGVHRQPGNAANG